MRSLNILLIVAFASVLAACGGGGSAAPMPELPPIVITPPPGTPAPFTGAFTAVDGTAAGYVEASSAQAVAERLAALIAGDPARYSNLYQKMLGTEGLKITVYGAKTGNSPINGAPIYALDLQFIAKMTAQGVVVTRV